MNSNEKEGVKLMSSRSTYHADVSGFSVDIETDKDMVNISNVIDSDGDLVADESGSCFMEVGRAIWKQAASISFTAELTSRVNKQIIDGRLYNVRECYLIDPKIAK